MAAAILEDGLAWMRAEIHKLKQKQEAPTAAQAYAAQQLHDFYNGWLAVEAWDASNPEDATLTGLGDDQLRQRFIEHGFVFYGKASAHENMRFALADFVTGQAIPNNSPDLAALGWNTLLKVLDAPESGVTWVELRPVFDAAHAGGAFDAWGENRTRHSVRAVQAGLNHFGNPGGTGYLREDGFYGPVRTRPATRLSTSTRTESTPRCGGSSCSRSGTSATFVLTMSRSRRALARTRLPSSTLPASWRG